jgi:hypothetical protein
VIYDQEADAEMVGADACVPDEEAVGDLVAVREGCSSGWTSFMHLGRRR